MYKLLPLEGFDSYFAFQAYTKLLFGLKMLPMYMGEDWESFFERIDKMSATDKMKMIRQAVFMVNLDSSEVSALLLWATDKHGVPFSRENMKRMGPEKIHEILIAVASEISKIQINYVSDAEKKN